MAPDLRQGPGLDQVEVGGGDGHTTEKKPGAGALGGKGGIIAMILGGVTGMACVGGLLYKAFTPAKAAPRQQSPGEARIASKAEEARDRAEAGVPRMRQEDVGMGYQFDALGNYLPPKVDPKDLPDNQPLISIEPAQPSPASRIAAGIQEESPRSWREDRDQVRETDPGMFKERREAKKEDRADLQGSMLGYTTSTAARWAIRRAERGGGACRDHPGQSRGSADPGQQPIHGTVGHPGREGHGRRAGGNPQAAGRVHLPGGCSR